MTEGGCGSAGKKMKRKNNGSTAGGGFQSLGLSEVVYRGIVKMGYRMPTPVQRRSLPIIFSGADTVVMARTGSGKTAAFLIPILERLLASPESGDKAIGAVILSPTRELSLQTLRVLKTLASFCTSLNMVGINGGESMENQFTLLSSRPDVIVATPGRLAHHLSEISDLTLKSLQMLVFDEADRLFEMGFAMQIRQICAHTPANKQTLMFSATMPKVLVEFTANSGIMSSDPQVVRLDQEASVSDELRIGFITTKTADKDAAFLHLLRHILPTAPSVALDNNNDEEEEEEEVSEDKKTSKKGWKKDKKLRGPVLGLTLIFAATRHHVEYLTTLLNNSGITQKATCIYGTMDQEARKIHLASFRSGSSPILVVTDVAARGIDVPLIDHVIHYSFPPSAKLFVHRSGRAARAGRIGYCWGLVDTEELPYLVDLFLFLGRKLSTGRDVLSEGDSGEESTKEESAYSLMDMTPEMVHYGSMPESALIEEIENVRRITDSELTCSNDAETLRSLVRVCDNAMKQYRRSRPEASREGIRRARAILEGEKERSGKRVRMRSIPPHPVLRGAEVEKLLQRGEPSDKDVKAKMDDLKKRDDFLCAMANFRPKETAFEAFAIGGGGNTAGVVSHIDKGRTTNAKNNESNAALTAMKGMRRQMKIVMDKGSSLVVAGSQNALGLKGDVNSFPGVEQTIKTNEEHGHQLATQAAPVVNHKRCLSKAQRKCHKKDPVSAISAPTMNELSKKTKEKRGSDFRDESFYIDHDIANDTAESRRSRQIEAAMQPSSSVSAKDSMTKALRLEETMLDIVGDENVDLVKRHRMVRWDKSKRKYVQTTLEQERSSESKTKKMRLESGQLIKSDKMKLGELYKKWQKKTNKSIGRIGVFDDVTTDDNITGAESMSTATRGGVEKRKRNGNKHDEGLLSASQIRKQRGEEKSKRMKNMKKTDRRRMEHRESAEKKSKKAMEVATKGRNWHGKKGFSERRGTTPGKKGKR